MNSALYYRELFESMISRIHEELLEALEFGQEHGCLSRDERIAFEDFKRSKKWLADIKRNHIM